ncbi:MAG: L,D-transpeptidase [Bacteroidales bacterium]|nr:L,D-transpeptidase [Bacteroidales bacterium]
MKVLVVFFLGLLFSALLSWPIVRNFSRIQETALRFKPKAELKATAARIGPEKFSTYQASLEKELAAIRKKLAAYIPKQPYLIINTSGNDFLLMKDGQQIRHGMCSTGSYTVLQAGEFREWIFKTPRGMFHIQGKTPNPVWRKPDWAFVEDGLPIPSATHHSRYEYGVLGDYALSLGKGYLIHGTLYKRFLGMPVTHGCIRMGDEDLADVYKTLPIGARVYIY